MPIFSETHNLLLQIQEELFRVCSFDVLAVLEVSNNYPESVEGSNSAFLNTDMYTWDPPEDYEGAEDGFEAYYADQLASFLTLIDTDSIDTIYDLFEMITAFVDDRD